MQCPSSPRSFQRPLRQHGARRRIQRRAGGCAPHGWPRTFEQFAEVQGEGDERHDLSHPGLLRRHGHLVLFFIYFMLPHFVEMFNGFNVEFPFPTRILIRVSYVLTHLWWLVILGWWPGDYLQTLSESSPEGRRKLDQWKMNLPVFGKVVRSTSLPSFRAPCPLCWKMGFRS